MWYHETILKEGPLAAQNFIEWTTVVDAKRLILLYMIRRVEFYAGFMISRRTQLLLFVRTMVEEVQTGYDTAVVCSYIKCLESTMDTAHCRSSSFVPRGTAMPLVCRCYQMISTPFQARVVLVEYR